MTAVLWWTAAPCMYYTLCTWKS